MNLAQLVDPEWAQQGVRVRFEPVRRVDPAAIRLSPLERDVCAEMALAPDRWWKAKELGDRTDHPQSSVNVALGRMASSGVVEVEGEKRFSWRITQTGLEVLRADR
jgi:hypothetical protein